MRLDVEEIGDVYGEASEILQDNKGNKYTNIIRSQAFKDLGEVQSREREQQVQRSWGRNGLDMAEKQRGKCS